MATTELCDRDATTAITELRMPPSPTEARRTRRKNHSGQGGSAAALAPHFEPHPVDRLLPSAALAILDPLEDDRDDDMPVVTTARGLVRLVAVAAQTGQRFRDDGIVHDPVAWMLSPRKLFGGKTALEACQRRSSFVLATMLHGLSMGLDCRPAELQALLDPDVPDEENSPAPVHGEAGTGPDGLRPEVEGFLSELTEPRARAATPLRALERSTAPRAGGWDRVVVPSVGGSYGDRPRLYTATMSRSSEEQVYHLFHASLADSRDEFADMLKARLGDNATRGMTVTRGIDWCCPAVEAIVASQLSHLLDGLEHDATARAVGRVDLWVERRLPPVPL